MGYTTGPSMSDCIFCRILKGDLPSSVVYRDDLCLAFLDIHPINSGHVLVVPLRHAAELAELDPPIAGHLMVVAQRITAALRASTLRCDGVNLLLADGEAAGQEVFHVHVHVVPRYEGDDFGFRRVFQSGDPTREELDVVAAQIRDSIAP
jgi:histidine triad (HIT) family protein